MPTPSEALRLADELADVIADLEASSDRAYCDYIEKMRRPECLGWEHKVKVGKFGEDELTGHTRAGELLGRHRALADALIKLKRLHALASASACWQDISTAPKDGRSVLLLGRNARHADGFWEKKAYAGNGCWVWPYVKAEPIAWQPLPPSPAAEAAAEREVGNG